MVEQVQEGHHDKRHGARTKALVAVTLDATTHAANLAVLLPRGGKVESAASH